MKIELVLVIDDQEADQMLARYAIESYNPNATIYTAFDGREALDLLETIEKIPDIIFLDINMPRMNGFEFLENYSQSSHQAQILIMLTSSDQMIDRSKCSKFECVKGYEPKPISFEILQELERQRNT